MRLASLSLALTAVYVLLAVYALDVARVLGPVYALTVVALWMTARPWRRPRG